VGFAGLCGAVEPGIQAGFRGASSTDRAEQAACDVLVVVPFVQVGIIEQGASHHVVA